MGVLWRRDEALAEGYGHGCSQEGRNYSLLYNLAGSGGPKAERVQF